MLASSVLLLSALNKKAGLLSNLSSTIMKTFLLLAFSLTTALAQVANAEDQDQVKHPNKHQQAPANRRTAITQTPKFPPSATVRQQTLVNRAPHVNPVTTNQTPKVRSFVNRDAVRANRLNQNSEFKPRVRTNPSVVTTPQTTTTVQSDVNARNRFDRNRTNTNSQNRTNTNWQNSTSANLNWADARRRHHRDRHDRSWWSSRYNRFVLFGGGYYFWDNNYWYPAYGYDPTYNSYSYDEPIYGYNDLDPGQVIANVQTELQRLGYYRYAVDGQMGPMTRAAIANYQRDNGLAITSAIDGPTLGSLGLG
jgi:Putative peptidoglycan binding domain